MAVSDTLSDAAEDIRRQLQTRPEVYAGFRAEIETALKAMDRARLVLDRPPGTEALPEPPWTVARGYDAGDQVQDGGETLACVS